MKNKLVAGLLAIFLGGLGVHKFYLGRTTAGVIILIINILLCWTIIVPVIIEIIVFIQGIILLCSSDENFNARYN